MGRSLEVKGEHAWAVLAGLIVAYEVLCDEDELLSVAVDRWLVSRPVVTRLAVAAVALHLLNVTPYWCDPLSKRFWARVRSVGRALY